MEEDSGMTKKRRFIIELKDKVVNIIFLLYVKLESKNNALDIRGSSGEREDHFMSHSYGPVVELTPRPTWSMIVIRRYKKNKLSSSHHFD